MSATADVLAFPEPNSLRVKPRPIPDQCIVRDGSDEVLRRRRPGWMQYLVIFQ